MCAARLGVRIERPVYLRAFGRAGREMPRKQPADKSAKRLHFSRWLKLWGDRSLGNLLMNKDGATQDLAVLILQMLPAANLLLCSMACSGLRQLVDRQCNAAFARDLMWWTGLATAWTRNEQVRTASWHEPHSHFTLKTTLDSANDRIMWLLNTNLAKDSEVKMRMPILLPASNPFITLTGERALVAKIVARGVVSVDVLAWRVCAVESGESGASGSKFVKVRLSAVEFSHNDARVALTIGAPCVLTVSDVLQQTWPLRCLWVMRGIRRCMYCHQRWRAMQSFDVAHANHRVLCTHCLELLYVREAQLVRRWHVRPRDVQGPKVLRVHFVNCYTGAPTVVHPTRPDVFILKADVAARFKCADWAEFIKRNHALNRLTRQSGVDAKYMFNSHWW